MLSDFEKYVKTVWKDKPDTSTPINAENLNHNENGVEANSEAIKTIADAVVSDIVNDANKIASMAAAYGLQNQITEVDERLAALEHMTLQNLFTVPVAIDSTGTTLLADDLGNAIVADWKYKEE